MTEAIGVTEARMFGVAGTSAVSAVRSSPQVVVVVIVVVIVVVVCMESLWPGPGGSR
ncbi:hypothetical protein [Streptomyces sp. NPDC015131]|uniref:hypothetical protein n=1 Tax=Streptomyces sp. NPDC015131 TaxID=3364941 RepID=UPI0036FC2C79